MSYTPTLWETGDVITAQKLNKMENAMHAILSDYEPTNWVDGDIITAEKLNKLENAIAYVNFDYVKTTWKKDDIITATLLNNIENGIEIASVDKTWNEMNWNDIIAATRTGKYLNFNVGDRKELNLGTEGVIHMQIVGIDVDDLADGSGKASLTFISVELLNTTNIMNPTRSPDTPPYDEGTGAIGGWEMCEMREYILGTVAPKFPDTIRENVQTVTKYSRICLTSGTEQNDVGTSETFFIPSFREVFGNTEKAETIGPVYSGVFGSASGRIKHKSGDSTAIEWWLRTAYNLNTFKTTKVNGDATQHRSDFEGLGIAIGFCL